MEIRNRQQNLGFGYVNLRGGQTPRKVVDLVRYNSLKFVQVANNGNKLGGITKEAMILEGTPENEKRFVEAINKIKKQFNIKIRRLLPEKTIIARLKASNNVWTNK